MATPRRTGLFSIAAALGLAIIGGAIWLQSFRPTNRILGTMIASEVFHISAHLVLYGSLAVILLMASGRRRLVAFAGVALVGLLQESAQAASGHRLLGKPELFDLCVDMVALSVVLLVESRAWARGSLRAEPGAR